MDAHDCSFPQGRDLRVLRGAGNVPPWLRGRCSDRQLAYIRRVKRPEQAFGYILQITGLAGVLFIPILVRIGLVGGVFFRWLPNRLLQFDGYVIHLFYSALLFLVPSVVMGMGFPFLIQMRKKYFSRTGETVATAYSINTVGSVSGTLVTGLILIPIIGAQPSIQLLGMAAVIGGLAVMAFIKSWVKSIFPLAAAGLALVLVVGVSPRAYLEWINICEARGGQRTELVDILEGINTTASVHLYVQDGTKVISTAGINVAGDNPELRQTQKVQGHVPIILHGESAKSTHCWIRFRRAYKNPYHS
jgi:hypothetical protein